jgi:Type IV secretion-system coupling protein DNA-binding domain
MEVIVAVIVIVAIFRLVTHPRFWAPFRGAPDVKSATQANAVTDRRIDKLQALGQHGNALAVLLGIIRIPLEMLNKPVILFGLPGCGKTSLINIMLLSLFKLFSLHTSRTRFVFLDVKNELPRRLHALVPNRIPIHYLNPLDLRASVLDFPKIFANRSDLYQLAHTICPPLPGDQTPFFRNCARNAIGQVACVLQMHQPHATRPWGLFDLCSILCDKKLLRRVMYQDYEAKTFFKATLAPSIRSGADVFSTIRSVIQPLIPAALVEKERPTRFDLKSFLKEDGIAVLGIPPTSSQAVLPLFNVFIRRLIEEAQHNSHPDDRLFLCLDEIALLDRSVVDSIIKATCVGRSHGIHVIGATQSLDLLEAQFGKDQAHAFLASCATTVGFRCGSRKSAEFVVGRMGHQDGIITLRSHTSSSNGGSSTVAEQLQSRPTVMVEELLHAPLADPIDDQMTFFAVCPTFGNAKVTCSFVRETTVESDSTFPNTLPRHSGAGAFRGLTESDLRDLGFPPVGRI